MSGIQCRLDMPLPEMVGWKPLWLPLFPLSKKDQRPVPLILPDFGVKYKIFFGDDAPIWKTGAYTFDISNTNQRISPSDEKVKRTIISIIEEFFKNNADILLYICETGDNKQSMRIWIEPLEWIELLLDVILLF